METKAGKSSLPHDHPLNMGSVGVTGSSASNLLAEQADVVLAVGSRLQDFTTGSWALFKAEGVRIIGLNTQAFDAGKHRALPLVADARVGLEALDRRSAAGRAPDAWTATAQRGQGRLAAGRQGGDRPDQCRAALRRAGDRRGARGPAARAATLVCASGGLPGELHKLWPAGAPGSYHMEYGYSTMGYEIAGGLGVKLAKPRRTTSSSWSATAAT